MMTPETASSVPTPIAQLMRSPRKTTPSNAETMGAIAKIGLAFSTPRCLMLAKFIKRPMGKLTTPIIASHPNAPSEMPNSASGWRIAVTDATSVQPTTSERKLPAPDGTWTRPTRASTIPLPKHTGTRSAISAPESWEDMRPPGALERQARQPGGDLRECDDEADGDDVQQHEGNARPVEVAH